jgi:type II protein arginine methyltransferase
MVVCLQFIHPERGIVLEGHNTRWKSITFPMDQSVTVHGFAGYFDCALYKEIGFSTVPNSHSPGMFSWFPMFLPLTKPVRVDAGDNIQVDLWRCVDAEKMWYEWSLQLPFIQGVQNSFGCSFSVKL